MLLNKFDKKYPKIQDIFASSEDWLEFLVEEMYKISQNLIKTLGTEDEKVNIFINFINSVDHDKDLDKFYLFKAINKHKDRLISLANEILLENKKDDFRYFYFSEQFSRLLLILKSFSLLESLEELDSLTYSTKKSDVNLFATKQTVSEYLASEASIIQFILNNSLFFLFTNREEKKNLKVLLESPYFYKTLALLYTKQELKVESVLKISKIYQVDLSDEENLIRIVIDTSNWSINDAVNLINLGYKTYPTFLKFTIEDFGNEERRLDEYLEIFYFLSIPIDDEFEIVSVFIEDKKYDELDNFKEIMKDSFISNKDLSSFYPIYEASVLLDLFKNDIYKKISYLSHNAINRKIFVDYNKFDSLGRRNELGIYYYPIRVLAGAEIKYELDLLKQKYAINKFQLEIETNDSKEEQIFGYFYSSALKEQEFLKIFYNFADFSLKFHNAQGDKKLQKKLIDELLLLNSIYVFDVEELYTRLSSIYMQKKQGFTDNSYYRALFSELIKILLVNFGFKVDYNFNFFEKNRYFVLFQENLKDFYFTYSLTLVERQNRNMIPIFISLSYVDKFDTFASYPFLNFLDYTKFVAANINRFQKEKNYTIFLPKLYSIIISDEKIGIVNYNKFEDFSTDKGYEVIKIHSDFNNPTEVEYIKISYMPILPLGNFVK